MSRYAIVSVNRSGYGLHYSVTDSAKTWTTRHKKCVDIRIFLQCNWTATASSFPSADTAMPRDTQQVLERPRDTWPAVERHARRRLVSVSATLYYFRFRLRFRPLPVSVVMPTAGVRRAAPRLLVGRRRQIAAVFVQTYTTDTTERPQTWHKALAIVTRLTRFGADPWRVCLSIRCGDESCCTLVSSLRL